SDRERQVMSLVGQGREDAQIAEQLHVAMVTVRKWISRLERKATAANRTQLLVMLYRGGLLDAGEASPALLEASTDLTDQQRGVLGLLATEGLTTEQLARRLNCALSTTKYH